MMRRPESAEEGEGAEETLNRISGGVIGARSRRSSTCCRCTHRKFFPTFASPACRSDCSSISTAQPSSPAYAASASLCPQPTQ